MTLPLGTFVKAERWDIDEHRLRYWVGTVIEHMPHDSGDCYAIQTIYDGPILDVLASLTEPLTLDQWFRELDHYLAIPGTPA